MSVDSAGGDDGWDVRVLAIKAVALALFLAVLYLVRPLIHGLAYRLVYSPGGALVLGLTLVAAVILFFAPPRGNSIVDSIESKATLVAWVFVVALVLAILVGVPTGMLEERTLAEQTMASATEVETFPAVNEANPRITPRDVSDVTTRGSVSYRKYRLGPSDIARMEDGRLGWSYSIEPEGVRNSLVEHQPGVVVSDMTSQEDREIRAVDDRSFAVGEGMALTRSADWNLKKSDYWAQYRDDPVEFVHEGDPYLAYPKTGHEWHLAPLPHTTPTWEGVALVHEDGTIEHLSPAEAREHPVLEGQRLYPLYNTEREMAALGYRNGIVNQLPVVGAHEGEIEVARLPAGAGNSQPFVIDLAGERMSYVTAMEPYGEDTRGLDEVWFADATTGEYRYYATGSETLTGPERAMGIVRSADTQTNWGDDFEVVEPVPVTVDDELWWHAKVVPTDFTDVSRNVFVNAHTGEAVAADDTDAIVEFLAGGDLEPVENVTTEDAPEASDVAYYVVVRDEDGRVVDRIPIGPGEEISIVQEGEADDQTA